MQARVTEKLVKHKKIVILKHSPCTVIGWELHPADRLHKDGAQRFLDYLPLCVFLKFEGAAWIVDERLGPGVWPLYPVERTWTLNEALNTKIRRKGFTLLPDYASTAFMIQGATLAAAIADCGDIAEFGSLSELMTTYVILSRVKSADGLLLLRAFCHNMFQMGALPGPYCLLKLLRQKFGTPPASPASHAGAAQDDAENQRYGATEAIAEYKQRVVAHEAWRAQRKQSGADWRCGDCGLSCPAAGGARSQPKLPTANSQQSATSNQQPTASSQKAAASSQQQPPAATPAHQVIYS